MLFPCYDITVDPVPNLAEFCLGNARGNRRSTVKWTLGNACRRRRER